VSLGIRNSFDLQILDHMLRNQAFTPPATVYCSLHTGHPGETGSNEVVGGSYARQAISWNAAAGGAMTNSAALDFAGMPAVTVTHFGIWDADPGGNFLWWGQLIPATGAIRATFTAQASDDTFTSYAHGLSNDMRVELATTPGSALPGGVSENTIYFVVNAGADTFELSATQGGGTIDLSTDGEGIALQIEAKTVGAGDTLRIDTPDLTVALD
jgi:hypothetical protein